MRRMRTTRATARARHGARAVALVALLGTWACSAPATPPPAPASPTTLGPAGSRVRLSDGTELQHLSETKAAILAFHESGEWERQVDEIARQARDRLDAELPGVARPAIVLDVDDTALSTFAIQQRLGFGWVPDGWDEWARTATAPAHRGILDLYRHALRKGVAVFFVTGRREDLRAATERQLRAAGYGRWVGLSMKPDDYDEPSAVPFKVARRRAIEEEGFEILLNVGDQWSDLEGGHARATFKLPNPVYWRP